MFNSDDGETAFPVAGQPESDCHFSGERMLAERKLALVAVAVDDRRFDERIDLSQVVGFEAVLDQERIL